MNKLSALLLLISVMGILGCTKTSDGTHPEYNCRMTQLSGSMGKFIYYYDENRNILKVLNISPPADTGWENYHYENGHVVYMIRIYQGTLGDTINYTYDSGRYVEVNEYGYKLKYYYDEKSQLVKIEQVENSIVTNYTDYQYDNKGNCTRCLEYYRSGSAFEMDQVTDFEFGTQKNPFFSIGKPPLNGDDMTVGMYLSRNNITKYRVQYISQSMKLAFVYHYSIYTGNGYPLQYALTDSLNNLISSDTLSYACP